MVRPTVQTNFYPLILFSTGRTCAKGAVGPVEGSAGAMKLLQCDRSPTSPVGVRASGEFPDPVPAASGVRSADLGARADAGGGEMASLCG